MAEEQQLTKKTEFKKLDNKNFIERYQFLLQINDDIICQRYFRINGMTNEALESVDFKNVMDECVRLIQDDLISKCRVYDWYTNSLPMKMTGFVRPNKEYSTEDKWKILLGETDETIVCEDGEVVQKTFMEYPECANDIYVDNERPNEGEYVFKFTFLVDNEPKYQRIWDGGDYNKFIRNSVDLSNNYVSYKEKDMAVSFWSIYINKKLTSERSDLIYTIIKKICSVLGGSFSEKYVYTKEEKYGDVTYPCTAYNKPTVNAWREAVDRKTRDYFNKMYPSDRQLEYIDRYL